MDLVSIVVYLVIIAIVFTLALWIARAAPIAEPFKSIIVWVVYVIGALFLIGFLLSLIGHPIFNIAPLRMR